MTAKRIALFGAACVGLLATALFGPAGNPAAALPTFAQAYHVDCKACHSAVPALNAYGATFSAPASRRLTRRS